MNAETIRAALRCNRPGCACHRERGQVHCPTHADEHPSFSVGEAESGRVLVHCFAGCEQRDVIEALRERGLWDGKPPAPKLSWARSGRLEGPLVEVVRFLERYVVFPSNAATIATALWVAHTHALAAFEVTPYLVAQSAEKRSGKTRLLEVLELLTLRPWRVVQPSEAVLFRKIARNCPTLLLDEADTIFKSYDDRTEPLRAILNAGFRRGATVPRCVQRGKEYVLEEFETFCAKAVATIGKSLPDTIEDRSIVIRLNRATPAEQRKIRRLRFREADAEAAPVREALARWAEAATPRLREARPALPDELDGRASDAWEPMIAVAEEAGDGWAVVAWQAALTLSTGAAREDESIRVRLLADIRRVFEGSKVARIAIATTDLIKGLADDETSPWGEWRGRPITPEALARLLKPFRIRPTQWRDGDRAGVRGYLRADFEESWSRYLTAPSPSPSAFDPLHPLQLSPDAGSSHFSDPLQNPFVAGAENGANPDGTRVVASVAGSTPLEGEAEAVEAGWEDALFGPPPPEVYGAEERGRR